MRSRTTLTALAALAVTTAIAACGGSSSPGSSPSSGSASASGSGPITVGLLAPFTGPYAEYGTGYEQGIAAWEKVNGQPVVDGHKIDVVKLDDQCDVTTGLAAFRREASQMKALIGPSCSSEAPPLTPLIAADKIPMLDLGHAASITTGYKGGWIFRVTQPDAANQWAFGQYLIPKWRSEGITKVGLIYDTSVTDADAAKSWTAITKHAGMDLVATASFNEGVTDFSSQVLKLKNAGAQAYILQDYGPDESNIVKDMTNFGVKVPIASAEDTPYPFVVDKNTGPGINRVYFYTDYTPGNPAAMFKTFERAYGQVEHSRPLDVQWEGYLAMQTLVNALKQPGAMAGGEKLRQALANTHTSLGNGETLSFLPNGDQAQTLTYVAKIVNYKPVLEKLIIQPRQSLPGYQH